MTGLPSYAAHNPYDPTILPVSPEVDGEGLQEISPRTWNDRKVARTFALAGLIVMIINMVCCDNLAIGSWYAFKLMVGESIVFTLGVVVNRACVDAYCTTFVKSPVWRPSEIYPVPASAITFWFAAHVIGALMAAGLAFIIIFIRHPFTDGALRRLRILIFLEIALEVVPNATAYVVICTISPPPNATAWLAGALGIIIDWIGCLLSILGAYSAITLGRDPNAKSQWEADRYALAQALAIEEEERQKREVDNEKKKEFRQILKNPLLLMLMMQSERNRAV